MTAPTPARTTFARADRVSFRSLLLSEWVKLSSLPSIVISLVGIVVIGLGASLFLAATLESSGVPSVPSIPQTVSDNLTAITVVSSVVAGIIGVLAIGTEYASGTIRVTFTTVPARGRVLIAKAVVLFVTTVVMGLVASFGAASENAMAGQGGTNAPRGARAGTAPVDEFARLDASPGTVFAFENLESARPRNNETARILIGIRAVSQSSTRARGGT